MTSVYHPSLVPPRIFIALDPGLRNPGIAVFIDGALYRAGRVKIPAATHKIEDIAERSREVAMLIYNDLEEGAEQDAEQVVLEWPQIYKATRSKGDPNDLPPLVGVAMYFAGRLAAPVKSYLPRTWSGGLPKATTGDATVSPRGRMIWGLLSAAERDALDVSHDAIDATGIGLYHLGRLVRRRVYPGATEG